MPSAVTLADLRAQVMDRADMTNSDFPDAGRVKDYINQEAGQLYDIVVAAFENNYIAQDTIAVVSGTENYALPEDFYKLLGVYDDNDDEIPKFTMSDYGQEGFLKYRLMGSEIWFTPDTARSQTVKIFYIPEPTLLDAEEDAITFNIPTTGWEEYIVAGAAARLLQKEESDASQLLMEKEAARQRIIAASATRDAFQPGRVRDVYGRSGSLWNKFRR